MQCERLKLPLPDRHTHAFSATYAPPLRCIMAGEEASDRTPFPERENKRRIHEGEEKRAKTARDERTRAACKSVT